MTSPQNCHFFHLAIWFFPFLPGKEKEHCTYIMSKTDEKKEFEVSPVY